MFFHMRKFIVFVCLLFVPMLVSAQHSYQDHPEQALSDANKLFKEGKYDESIKLYKIYYALSARNMSKEINLAEACINQRNESHAFLDGKDYLNALKSTLSLYAVNQSDESNISLMKQALVPFVAQKKSVSNSDLLNRLHTVYDDFSKSAARKSMIPDLQKALALLGDKDFAYKVASELQQSSPEDAVVYYAISSDGTGTQAAESCMYLGDYYSGKSRYTDANKYYSKGIEKGSGDCAYKLGRYYEERISDNISNKQRALENYEKAKQLGNSLAATRIEAVGRVKQITKADTPTQAEKRRPSLFDTDGYSFFGLDFSFQKQASMVSVSQNIDALFLRLMLGKFKDGTDPLLFFENVTNTGYQLTKYQPNGIMMAAPGIYLKYLSFDVGVGFVSFDSSETVASVSGSSISIDSVDGIRIDKRINNNISFAMQPRLALNYPFKGTPFRIGAHFGYTYVPGFPSISGVFAGAGIGLDLEEIM